MDGDLVDGELRHGGLVLLHDLGQLLLVVLDLARQVGALAAHPEELVLHVRLGADDVVELGLDVGELEVGVLLGLQRGGARELGVFELEKEARR